MNDAMTSFEVIRIGFVIISVIGLIVGGGAGLWAISRGHIRKGIVACIACVPYAYFMLFEPRIRPTNMEPKGDPTRNMITAVFVGALLIGLLLAQWLYPPLSIRGGGGEG